MSTPVLIDIKLTSETSGADTASRKLQTMTTDAYNLAQAMTAMRQKASEWSGGYAAEIEAASRADMAHFAAMARKNEATEKGNQLTAQTRTASSNAALGVLELSRAFEDAQYGIRGVINNIPTMLMLFGASGGLAGVVSIAAVSLSLLTSGMGEAEKAADTLAKSTRDAVHAAADKAEKSAKAAEAARVAAEADRALQEEVAALEKTYNGLISAQEASAASSARQEKAARLVAEALKEQALEQIRLDEMNEKITGDEAARRRGGVEMQDAAAQEQARAADAARRKADLDAKAQAAEEEAKRLREAAEAQVFNELPAAETARFEDQKKLIEAQMKDAGRRQAQANEKRAATQDPPGMWETLKGNLTGTGVIQQDAERRQGAEQAAAQAEAAKQEQAALAEQLRQIEEQKRAAFEAGAKKATQRAEEARKLADQRDKEAAAARRQSEDIAVEDAAAAQAYGIRQSTRGMRTAGEESQARLQREEEERKTLEKDQEEMRRARERADRAGERRGGLARRARNAGEDANLPERAERALEKLTDDYASGKDDGTQLANFLDRMEKYLEGQARSVASNAKNRKAIEAKLEAQQRRIDELEAQIRNAMD